MHCSLPPSPLTLLHADELPHNFIMINTMTFQSRPQYKANDAARGLQNVRVCHCALEQFLIDVR